MKALAERDFTSFEVRTGNRRIRCAVSMDALDYASGLPTPSALSLRRFSFDRFRMLIDAAAKLKAASIPAQAGDEAMVLTIADLRRVPQQHGTPHLGTTFKQPPSHSKAVLLPA